MKCTGIQKGDKDFRHFTFDEDDFIVKNNIRYYKVNYGKNKLEGPDAEDEIGYVDAANIIVLGGSKPSFLFHPQQNPIVEEKSSPEPVSEPPTSEKEKQSKSKTVPNKQPDQKKPVGRPKKIKTDNPVETSQKSPKDVPSDLEMVKKEAFEYTIKELVAKDIDALKEQLNLLGSEGWEMCGFDTYKTLFTDIRIISIFKKRVS